MRGGVIGHITTKCNVMGRSMSWVLGTRLGLGFAH